MTLGENKNINEAAIIFDEMAVLMHEEDITHDKDFPPEVSLC